MVLKAANQTHSEIYPKLKLVREIRKINSVNFNQHRQLKLSRLRFKTKIIKINQKVKLTLKLKLRLTDIK